MGLKHFPYPNQHLRGPMKYIIQPFGVQYYFPVVFSDVSLSDATWQM